MTDTTREELARSIHLRLIEETEQLEKERIESFVRDDDPAGKRSQGYLPYSGSIATPDYTKAAGETNPLNSIYED